MGSRPLIEEVAASISFSTIRTATILPESQTNFNFTQDKPCFFTWPNAAILTSGQEQEAVLQELQDVSLISQSQPISQSQYPRFGVGMWKSINDTFDEAMVKNSVEFLPLGLALWVVIILGLVGNILGAVVLMRPRMKSTYSILTLGLTLCDILYLFMKLFGHGLLSLYDYLRVRNYYTEVVYPLAGPYIRALTFTGEINLKGQSGTFLKLSSIPQKRIQDPPTSP